MDLGLKDRVALIGGASQGLGRAAAEVVSKLTNIHGAVSTPECV